MTSQNRDKHTTPDNLHAEFVRPQALIQTTTASLPLPTDVLDLGTIIMFQGFWWAMLLTAVGFVVCSLLGIALCIYRGRLRVKRKQTRKNLEFFHSEVDSTHVDPIDVKLYSVSSETLQYPPSITKPEDTLRIRDMHSTASSEETFMKYGQIGH